MIELTRIIPLGATPAEVWHTLWDIAALADCIPGCDGVTEVEPKRRYRATVRDRVGPFTVSIPLDISVDSIDEGRSLSITASGRDSALGSPVKVKLAVSVAPDAAGSRLTIDGGGEIGGKLAALGQAVTYRKTRDTLERFAENLQQRLGGPARASAV